MATPKWKRDKADVDDASKKRGDLATTGGWFFPRRGVCSRHRCSAAPITRSICLMHSVKSAAAAAVGCAGVLSLSRTIPNRRNTAPRTPSSSSSSSSASLRPLFFPNACHPCFVPLFGPSFFFSQTHRGFAWFLFSFRARATELSGKPEHPSLPFHPHPPPLCLPFVFAS